jgi:hypothetical protein
MIHHLIQVLVDSLKGLSTYLGEIEADIVTEEADLRSDLEAEIDRTGEPESFEAFNDAIVRLRYLSNARDTLARYLDIFNIPSEPAPFHDLIDLAMGAFKGIENGDLGSASGMRAAFVPLNNLTDTLATLAAAEEKEDEADSTTECFDDAVNEALNADHE